MHLPELDSISSQPTPSHLPPGSVYQCYATAPVQLRWWLLFLLFWVVAAPAFVHLADPIVVPRQVNTDTTEAASTSKSEPTQGAAEVEPDGDFVDTYEFTGEESVLPIVGTAWTCVWMAVGTLLPNHPRVRTVVLLCFMALAAVQVAAKDEAPTNRWTTLVYYYNQNSKGFQKLRHVWIDTFLTAVSMELSVKAAVHAAMHRRYKRYLWHILSGVIALARAAWLLVLSEATTTVLCHTFCHAALEVCFWSLRCSWVQREKAWAPFVPVMPWHLPNFVDRIFYNFTRIKLEQHCWFMALWWVASLVLAVSPSLLYAAGWAIACWTWALLGELRTVPMPHITLPENVRHCLENVTLPAIAQDGDPNNDANHIVFLLPRADFRCMTYWSMFVTDKEYGNLPPHASNWVENLRGASSSWGEVNEADCTKDAQALAAISATLSLPKKQQYTFSDMDQILQHVATAHSAASNLVQGCAGQGFVIGRLGGPVHLCTYGYPRTLTVQLSRNSRVKRYDAAVDIALYNTVVSSELTWASTINIPKWQVRFKNIPLRPTAMHPNLPPVVLGMDVIAPLLAIGALQWDTNEAFVDKIPAPCWEAAEFEYNGLCGATFGVKQNFAKGEIICDEMGDIDIATNAPHPVGVPVRRKPNVLSAIWNCLSPTAHDAACLFTLHAIHPCRLSTNKDYNGHEIVTAHVAAKDFVERYALKFLAPSTFWHPDAKRAQVMQELEQGFHFLSGGDEGQKKFR